MPRLRAIDVPVILTSGQRTELKSIILLLGAQVIAEDGGCTAEVK